METDQPLLSAVTNKNQNAATYCQDMVNLQPAKLQLDTAKEASFTSPVPAIGNNLATFMGARLAASFTNMNCQNFGLTNPVTVTTDGNGVATAVTISTAQQQAKLPAGAGRQAGRRYNRGLPGPQGTQGERLGHVKPCRAMRRAPPRRIGGGCDACINRAAEISRIRELRAAGGYRNHLVICRG